MFTLKKKLGTPSNNNNNKIYLFYFQAKKKSPKKFFELKSIKKKKIVTEQAHQGKKAQHQNEQITYGSKLMDYKCKPNKLQMVANPQILKKKKKKQTNQNPIFAFDSSSKEKTSSET